MTPEQKKLLERIESAPLVSDEEDLLFTRKLAVQHGWSTHQALKAIREYRRFLFLAMAAGHPVSPSDAVDQVWHQHLMHTMQYWNRFCPEVLGRPFHHCPNAGGERERAKFQDWYAATLKSYAKFFHEPPADFWPVPERKAKIDQRVHRRVDLTESWVIAKPVLFQNASWKPALTMTMLLLLVLFGTGCSAVKDVAPFNFDGPTFLGFFSIMLVSCWTLAYFLRRHNRGPEASSYDEVPCLNAYEMAYLAGGTRRLTQVILAKLSARGAISLDEKTNEVCQLKNLGDDADHLERIVFSGITGQPLPELQSAITPALDHYRTRLEELGLLISSSKRISVTLPSFFVAAIPLIFGGIKLWNGLLMEKPVTILVILLLISLGVALAFASRPFRSRRGDAALRSLEEEYMASALKGELRGSFTAETATILCLAIALYGADVLAGTAYNDLRSRLGPESSGGCGGGCGGGDGGGGGCGGGCGGCGG